MSMKAKKPLETFLTLGDGWRKFINSSNASASCDHAQYRYSKIIKKVASGCIRMQEYFLLSFECRNCYIVRRKREIPIMPLK